MNRSSKKDKGARLIVFSLFVLFLFSPMANAADHTIKYPSFLEEFSWTYGCTPTAASMVLSYWDTTHVFHVYGVVSKYNGLGRLIDYY